MATSHSHGPLAETFAGKTVWLSGHTGFKGSWLAHWLLDLGANVHGYALEPRTSPALFNQLDLEHRLGHEIGDLRDAAAVSASIHTVQPDFVFHLGAQAIVRTSFAEPVETYATNVMGTIHVLESLRKLTKPCAAVLVTTDKCYENQEWVHGYREEDKLGGYDPYSSSKAAMELVIASWRRSFFSDHPVSVASGRAGNVIGGGDWAKDRIVPDCIRALQAGEPIPVRNKISTRPWQHVLDPLACYLWLATVLSRPSLRQFDADLFASSFNFGPELNSNRSVAELVMQVLQHWPGSWQDRSDPGAVHEATRLNLATDKAFHLLGCRPVWGFDEAIAATVGWYRTAHELTGEPSATSELIELTSRQIAQYRDDAGNMRLPWQVPSSPPATGA